MNRRRRTRRARPMSRRQKKRMIRLIGCAVLMLCAAVMTGAVYLYLGTQEVRAQENSREEEANLKLALSDVLEDETWESLAAAEKVEEEEDLPEDWNLILVNRTHPMPEDYEAELKPIGSGHQIDARAYEDFQDMIAAARNEGVYIYVTSSYRTMDKQTNLHNQKIEEYVRQGYSRTRAKELAAQLVAVPGTSEHQLGLALDLVSSEYRRLDEKQENTKGFQWLKAHCQEYGFILRYPNGKTQVTGIIYEPWHFRYVGKKAAAEITKAGQTLEEYVGAKPVFEEEDTV